ncbi:MAG TPA: hypothetical protein VGB92_09485 [Longimicrobium sp.]
MPEFAPIGVLILRQRGRQLILSEGSGVVQQQRLNEIDREDQVVTPKFTLTTHERSDLITAFDAAEETGREDRDEEGRLAERPLDARLPLLAPAQISTIEEDGKRPS